MENPMREARHKKISRLIASAVAVAFPFFVYFPLRGVIFRFQPQYGEAFNAAQALALTGGVYFIFVAAFFIASSEDIASTFGAMRERLRDLFLDLREVPEKAWELYRVNVRWNGLWYLVYIGLFLYAAAWAAAGFARFFALI